MQSFPQASSHHTILQIFVKLAQSLWCWFKCIPLLLAGQISSWHLITLWWTLPIKRPGRWTVQELKLVPISVEIITRGNLHMQCLNAQKREKQWKMPIALSLSKKNCCQLDKNWLCSFLDREGSHKMLTFTLIARTHMPRIAESRRKSMTVLRSRSTTAKKTNFKTRTNQNARRRHRQTHIRHCLV